MTSDEARAILESQFPDRNIAEAIGNPNLVGWYLFTVDGRPTWVTNGGAIVGEE